MARYHLNPDNGPMVCRAKISCPYGADAPHFSSKAEAQAAYEKTLQAANPFPAHSRNERPVLDVKLLDRVDEMEFEMVEEFANTSPQNHALLDRVIDARAEAALEWAEKLDRLNPYKKREEACDKATFTSLKKDFDAFKNKTASLVEAHLESRFYTSKAKELEDTSRVGHAVAKTAYDPGTPEWLRERFDSVGGSDVGCLVTMDFTDEDKVMYWDRKSLEKVEASKLAPPSDEDIEKQAWLSSGSKRGPLYRGSVWEDRSRDKFVEDNPQYTVYNTKSQYYNPDRPWQQVNFDGILSDREDGQPNGILELKTGNDAEKWENGVPLSYRAQVLYYLNATKLDYAVVGATINDGEHKYFRLNRNDPVAPGKYDGSMEDYIAERVEPWFKGLQANRSAA